MVTIIYIHMKIMEITLDDMFSCEQSTNNSNEMHYNRPTRKSLHHKHAFTTNFFWLHNTNRRKNYQHFALIFCGTYNLCL